MFILPRTVEIVIQPQYADTDMMGVVYHANYLKYFELGRTAFIEAAGYSYVQMEEKGFYAPVYDARVTYKSPLRYGDKATLSTWLSNNDGIKTTYAYELTNENGARCVTGCTTHIIVKKDSFKPVAFKKAFPDWFHLYEEWKM
ncbi:acyl-CoA thioesterase [Shouchella lonarensis]|uniref:Acyl-CoA thioester hydrolase n=1 Tax=Shouchella lonarensis TaxID=1464122 RepID=A0A1G6HBX5_9BACI|nr:acyl-CoA thioester hydrolase [Shouchella lonarensis]